MINRHDDSGYRIHVVLDVESSHHFSYMYQIKAEGSSQHWAYSWRWALKNQTLMLLLDKSNYPGENKDDVLVRHLLQIGHSKLVYVRSGADELQVMTCPDRIRGS